MAYLRKDQVDAAVDGVYGSYGGNAAPVPVKPASGGKPKLHPAEQQVRDDYAADLDRQADTDGLEPDICRAMHGKANAIRSAMPVLDFQRALIAYNDALGDGPASGLESVEYRYGIGQAVQRLTDANPYPPDLVYAVQQAMLRGQNPDDIDLYQVTGIPDPDAQKSAVRPTVSQERIAELVQKELSRQMTLPRNTELRKALDEASR
jgi:hypothetical protein